MKFFGSRSRFGSQSAQTPSSSPLKGLSSAPSVPQLKTNSTPGTLISPIVESKSSSSTPLPLPLLQSASSSVPPPPLNPNPQEEKYMSLATIIVDVEKGIEVGAEDVLKFVTGAEAELKLAPNVLLAVATALGAVGAAATAAETAA